MLYGLSALVLYGLKSALLLLYSDPPHSIISGLHLPIAIDIHTLTLNPKITRVVEWH